MSDIQIMVVEDDLIVAQSIKKHLTSLGYQVPAILSNGKEAIKKAAENQPDLILMDIKLSGEIDGITAAQKIRKRFDIPVVYLTAYADKEILSRARITEPFGYILKPFGVKDLHSTVEIALYKYRVEERTEHLNQILRAIRSVNQLITKEKDLSRLLQNACQCLTETRGYYSAWIVYVDQSGKIINAAQAGLKQSSTTLLEQLKQGERPTCWQQVMQQAEPLFVEKPSVDCISCVIQETTPSWGRLVARLEHNQKIFGVMGVSLPQEWAEEDEERALFTEVTEDIAFALHGIEEEEKRKDIETALQRSELRYKQLLESITDYIYTVNVEDGVVISTFHGPGCEAVTGYTSEEFQAHPYLWFDMIHEEDRALVIKQADEILSGTTVSPLEHRILDKNGSTRWVRNTPVPQYNRNGTLITYEGLIYDITQRKEAETEAKKGRDQLQSIFRAAPTGIGMVVNRTLSFINERFIEMVGYSREELLGENSRILYPSDEEYLRVGEIKYNQIEKGNVGTVETKFRTKSGQIIDILLSSSPIDPQDLTIGVTFTALDITQRKEAEEALREAEIQYRTVADFTYDWEIWESPDGNLRYVSPSCERVTGYTADEFFRNADLTNQIILPEDRDYWKDYRQKILADPGPRETQFRIRRKDGEVRWLEHVSQPVTDTNGTFLGHRTSSRDISKRKQAEAEQEKLQDQLLQAQKMEAIGRLTGGIAHDFNNLLTAINGFAELAKNRLPANDPIQEMLGHILDSGHRAADLVRQLLAFSRKQIIEPKIINLNILLANLDKILRRIIGEDINTKTILAANLWAVKIDSSQIEQAIINLAVNARDAMPQGGQLTLTTANVHLTPNDVTDHPETAPGDYVLLSISDTGVGIETELLSNIFEPFFTTKEKGKGTGLGLAMVYGTVKQNQGDIWIESEVGEGTTVKIYLPRCADNEQALTGPKNIKEAPRGNETILLAEDDPEVCRLTRHILEDHGYTVLDTASGKQALNLVKNFSSPIHMLITDVVMPDINGQVLAQQMSIAYPDIKIIFISGYPDETIAEHGLVDEDVVFLQKPFTATQLTLKVRSALDKPVS